MPAASSEAAPADLIVIGSGVAGLCAARAARRTGLEVALVTGSQPRASEVAAGMIARAGELSWGEEQLHGAAVAASEAWPGFAEALGRETGREVPYRRSAALHVALDRDEAAELDRRRALIEAHGLEAARLTRSEARRLEPALAPGITAALEAPEEAEVDPVALLAALRASLDGVRILTEDAEAILHEGGAVAGVELGGDRLSAPRVILAAGAWSAAIAPVGDEVPVRPVKGEAVRLRAREGRLPIERTILTERVYLVPRRSGELVVGASVEERGYDLAVTAGGVHELLREAYRTVPEIAELEFRGAAAGLRPGTPDNAPIIGRSSIEGLLIATGNYRTGILMAPLIEAAIESMLEGGKPRGPLGGFGPERFVREPVG